MVAKRAFGSMAPLALKATRRGIDTNQNPNDTDILQKNPCAWGVVVTVRLLLMLTCLGRWGSYAKLTHAQTQNDGN